MRSHLHLVDNLTVDTSNVRLFKVRPIFNAVQNRCRHLVLEQKLCVDQQMVPFKGALSIKQYVKVQPYKWGMKIFLLCGESGLCYDLIVYQGKTTEIEKNLQETFGLGGGVVITSKQKNF